MTACRHTPSEKSVRFTTVLPGRGISAGRATPDASLLRRCECVDTTPPQTAVATPRWGADSGKGGASQTARHPRGGSSRRRTRWRGTPGNALSRAGRRAGRGLARVRGRLASTCDGARLSVPCHTPHFLPSARRFPPPQQAGEGGMIRRGPVQNHPASRVVLTSDAVVGCPGEPSPASGGGRGGQAHLRGAILRQDGATPPRALPPPTFLPPSAPNLPSPLSGGACGAGKAGYPAPAPRPAGRRLPARRAEGRRRGLRRRRPRGRSSAAPSRPPSG